MSHSPLWTDDATLADALLRAGVVSEDESKQVHPGAAVGVLSLGGRPLPDFSSFKTFEQRFKAFGELLAEGLGVDRFFLGDVHGLILGGSAGFERHAALAAGLMEIHDKHAESLQLQGSVDILIRPTGSTQVMVIWSETPVGNICLGMAIPGVVSQGSSDKLRELVAQVFVKESTGSPGSLSQYKLPEPEIPT